MLRQESLETACEVDAVGGALPLARCTRVDHVPGFAPGGPQGGAQAPAVHQRRRGPAAVPAGVVTRTGPARQHVNPVAQGLPGPLAGPWTQAAETYLKPTRSSICCTWAVLAPTLAMGTVSALKRPSEASTAFIGTEGTMGYSLLPSAK